MNFLLSKNTSLLVISPHADDEIIGCGGLIKKQSRSVEISTSFTLLMEIKRGKKKQVK